MKAGRRIVAGVGIAGLFVVAFFLNRAISQRVTPVRDASKRPLVVATVSALGSLAEQVAGDRMTVVTILPPGTSPHTFEPQPGDVANVQGASLLFEVGSAFDPWASVVVPPSVPRLIATNVSDLERVAFPTEAADERAEHGNDDPHVWLAPKNAGLLALALADRLSEIDPTGADVYHAHAHTLNDELIRLQDEERVRLAASGASYRLIAVHDGWRTFGKAFGVEIVGAVETTPGRVPSPSELARLQQLHATVVASEPQLSEGSVKTLACDLGLPLIELDAEGGTSGRERYQDLIRSDISALRSSVGAQPSCS